MKKSLVAALVMGSCILTSEMVSAQNNGAVKKSKGHGPKVNNEERRRKLDNEMTKKKNSSENQDDAEAEEPAEEPEE